MAKKKKIPKLAPRLGTEFFLNLVHRKAGAVKTDKRDRTRRHQRLDWEE